jgi:GNAT superfamily N-acetyltransferase
MDPEIVIRQIQAGDAEELSALAKKIYQQYYLHLWHPGGADWYMNEYAYPVNKLRTELEDENNIFFIAYSGVAPVGYLKISIHPHLENFNSDEFAELERIYILQKFAGKGLGKQFMQIATDTAKQYNKKYLFLKAMDSAAHAITFYKKTGYQPIANFQLPMPTFCLMKKEFRGMIVLSKTIG